MGKAFSTSVAGTGLSHVRLRGLDRMRRSLALTMTKAVWDRRGRATTRPISPSSSLDATKSVPPGEWDVVVLSNVLEHIVDRVGLLTTLVAHTHAKKFLIRVPHFERDWKMPMRRAVGANYYSDPDHKIEPTQAEFRDETARAGLVIDELLTPWGEIWATLHPVEGSP